MDTSSSHSAGSAGSGRHSTHLRDYWVTVVKRLPIVLVVLALGLAITWAITRNQPRRYATSATVELIPPRGGRASFQDSFVPTAIHDETYLNTQLRKLQMPATIEAAVRAAKLTTHPDFEGMTEAEIVRVAAGNVSARRIRGEYLLEVSVAGRRPEILNELANAIVQYFRDEQRDESEQRRRLRKTELEETVSGYNSRIGLAESNKRNTLQTQGYDEATFEAEVSRKRADRERFIDEKYNVEVWRLEHEGQYAAFQAAIDDPARGIESLFTHPFVAGDEDVLILKERLSQIEADINDLRARTGAGTSDPNRIRLESAQDRIRERLNEVRRARIENFMLTYENRVEQEARLKDRVGELGDALSDATRVQARIDELNAEIKRLTNDKASADRQLELLVPSTYAAPDSVKIVMAAREPDANRPVSPNKPLNYTMGTVVSLLIGIGIAFLMEYFDDTIRTKDELAKITEVALLGVVPRIEGARGDTARRDLFAYRQPKSTVAEAYRGVRTALTLRSRGSKHRVLLLTSAGPREGKTTTVLNVATVFAYTNTRTLIIDADLRKPRIHKSFGLDNSRGLSNLLVSDDAVPLEYCQSTEVPGVDVLASGPIPPNPSELLGAPRMRETLEKLRTYYDNILLDTPPIGAVTDSAVLGTMVDGVILVVHAGKTRRGVVSRGLEQLRYIHAPIEGVILNNLHIGGGRYYPGYYNYYYYYSYYGSGKERERRPAEPAALAGPEQSDSTA